MFRPEGTADQASVSPSIISKPPHVNMKFTLNNPQTTHLMTERRPSFRINKREETESTHEKPKSEMEQYSIRPPSHQVKTQHSIVQKPSKDQAQKTMQILKATHAPKFDLSQNQHFQTSMSTYSKKDYFSVSKATTAPKSPVKIVSTVKNPLRKGVETAKIFKDFEEYKDLPPPRKCKSKDPHKKKAHKLVRVHLKNIGKDGMKDALTKFKFDKKPRVVTNLKEKIAKNKKMIQYEARSLRKANEAESASFCKDVKLVFDRKYEFALERGKIIRLYEKRDKGFVPSKPKSDSLVFDYSNLDFCNKYIFQSCTRFPISAVSDCFYLRKYLKNEPKSMSKHIDKFLMMTVFNSFHSVDLYGDYRSELVLNLAQCSKAFRSRTIFSGQPLFYTYLPNPTVTVDQIDCSYRFRLRYINDEPEGRRNQKDGFLTINQIEVIKTSEFPLNDLEEKIPPKAMYLDKNTLINLLLKKYEYDEGGGDRRRRTTHAFGQSQALAIDDDPNRQRGNLILTKIDSLLNERNDKTRQFMMQHFQIANMSLYNDFFHRHVPIIFRETRREHDRSFRSPYAKNSIADVAVEAMASSGNKLFRSMSSNKDRGTGSEKKIKKELSKGKTFKDAINFKITVNHPPSGAKPAESRGSDEHSVDPEIVSQKNTNKPKDLHLTIKDKFPNSDNPTRLDLANPTMRSKTRIEDHDMDKLSHIPIKTRNHDLMSPSNHSISNHPDQEDEGLSPFADVYF